jgi:hypothetical protein
MINLSSLWLNFSIFCYKLNKEIGDLDVHGLGHDWFLVAYPCPNDVQNMLWTGLGSCCLLNKVQCLVIRNQSPSGLDQKSVTGRCNLWRWRFQLCPLAVLTFFSNFWQLKMQFIFYFFLSKLACDALPSPGVKHTWGFHKVRLRKVELGSTLPASNSRKG